MPDTQPIRNRRLNRLFVILMVLAAFAAAIGGSLYLLSVAEEAHPSETMRADSTTTNR